MIEVECGGGIQGVPIQGRCLCFGVSKLKNKNDSFVLDKPLVDLLLHN